MLSQHCAVVCTHSVFALSLTLSLTHISLTLSLSKQRMNLIIKGDTSGVVEAIKGAMKTNSLTLFWSLKPALTHCTCAPLTLPMFSLSLPHPSSLFFSLTTQRMNLIIKGDTSGVVEAIKGALQGLPQESVVLRYLLSAAGDITTSDVDLAAASGGMVVGFNLSPDENVLAHAKHLGGFDKLTH